MKNQLTIAGGFLTAISMFFPAVSFLGKSVGFMSSSKGVAYFWIICGIIILIVGILDRKKLNFISLGVGILVTLLALKYYNDSSGVAGLGILMMIAGGILSVIGSAKRLKEN